MVRFGLILGLLFIGLAAASNMASGDKASAGGQVNVRVSPVSQTSPAEAKASIEILVENVANLRSYEFRLAFDPAVLQYQSVGGAETFLESTGRTTLCLPGPNDFELKQAIIRFGCASSGLANGPSGGGVLVTITFSTHCSDTSGSDLVFVPIVSNQGIVVEAVVLTDHLGQRIATEAFGGKIDVPSCSPSATPAPTFTPQPPVTPLNFLPGDVSCDGTVNTLDAALLLQLTAGLLLATPCPWNSDVNGDGLDNPLDAALVLQFSAGLIGPLTLPSPTPAPLSTSTPTSRPDATSTRRPTFTPPPTVTAAPPTPVPSLSPAEAISLAFDWLTAFPPSPLGLWSIEYSSCEATWIHVAWKVTCEGTRFIDGRLVRNDLEVCVFEKTFIVTPFPC